MQVQRWRSVWGMLILELGCVAGMIAYGGYPGLRLDLHHGLRLDRGLLRLRALGEGLSLEIGGPLVAGFEVVENGEGA